MDALKAIKQAAYESGENLSTISKRVSNTRGYMNSILTRGSMPRIDTYVRIMNAAGYRLYAIEDSYMPETGIEITIDE